MTSGQFLSLSLLICKMGISLRMLGILNEIIHSKFLELYLAQNMNLVNVSCCY